MFDACVFIGAFQPPRMAHLAAMARALETGRQVILILGSHDLAPTPRNPWTTEERRAMLQACLASRDRIQVAAVRDCLQNDGLWAGRVRREVEALVAPGAKVALLGFRYASLFPAWTPVDLREVTGPGAAQLRHRLFTDPFSLDGEEALPPPVRDWLRGWESTEAYATLSEEHRQIESYRERWKDVPYPVNFVTADALVVKAEHVLLVERKHAPGRGLLALPGGFVDVEETLLDAALRELHEETRLPVPRAELLAGLRGSRVFDHPDRSQRGRVITHAFHFDLGEGPLPEPEASDDAARAFWMPLSRMASAGSRCFDDHQEIIASFV